MITCRIFAVVKFDYFIYNASNFGCGELSSRCMLAMDNCTEVYYNLSSLPDQCNY